jgi:hypothetical protein
VDPRFTTQAGIYQILEQADAVPGVHDIYIGRWLAWPAVKVLIYARLCDFLDAAPMASPDATRLMRGASLFSRLPATWLRLRSEIGKVPPPATAPRVAWLSGAYTRRNADGSERDALFGTVPEELATHAEQLWFLPPAAVQNAGGIHAEKVYAAATDLANQLTSLQRFRPAVRRAAAALADKLSTLTPAVAGLTWRRVLVDAISTFEARRIAWTAVFARTRPAVVLLTNAPYQVGEVAAAKSAGVMVAEFQHGLFGPRCPEYGWPGTLTSRRAEMAVADRFFVFGELFRGGALKNAFWGADDVRVVGSAEIERLRGSARPRTESTTPRRVLFLTQPMTRSEAVAFLDEFLSGVRDGKHSPLTVTIKVHPSERHAISEYQSLAGRHAERCRLADVNADTSQLMVEHDVVVSYTSYALIEAVGLGRAAVSISGEQSPGGVFALCPIPGAVGLIPTVSTPAELADAISSSRRADTAAAAGFFAEQRSGALLEAILDLIRTSAHPASAHR